MARFIRMIFILYVIRYFISADTTSFTTWELTIKINHDGTNGQVKVTLYGTTATTETVISCNDKCFRNSQIKFTFETVDIGSIKNIKLTVLNTNKWSLEEITIKNLDTSEVGRCKVGSLRVLYHWCQFITISSTTLKRTSPSVTAISSTLISTTNTDEQTSLQTISSATLKATSPSVTDMSSTLISTTNTDKQRIATCYSGWVSIEGLCYRIVNRKEDVNNAKDSCGNDTIVSTKIPDELADMIGYDEIVWTNRSGNLQACQMKNLSICTTSGKYNSLCSREVISASLTLVGPMPLYNASWLIPNTKKSFDIIKQHFLNCCASEGIWFGMYKKDSQLYWTDGSLVSENEKNLLNIVKSPEKNCALYNGSIIFIECSSSKMGLTSPYPPNNFKAVTSRMPSNSGHKFSTAATFIPTTDRPNPVYQSTTTARINMCFCPCPFPRKNISAEEFKETLKDIVIDKKDTSSYIRSKISAPDERTSSKAIGMVAIVVTVIPFCLLILSDIPILVCQVIATYKRIIKGNP